MSSQLTTSKETTNLGWNREDEVVRGDPDLVVIHASAFYGETNVADPEEKFSSFLRYVAERTDAKFLIYSRATESEEDLAEMYLAAYPFLGDRFDVMWMGDGRQWDDVTVGRELKVKVGELLDL